MATLNVAPHSRIQAILCGNSSQTMAEVGGYLIRVNDTVISLIRQDNQISANEMSHQSRQVKLKSAYFF